MHDPVTELREALSEAEWWWSSWKDYHPSVDPPRPGRVVDVGGFDIEEWVEEAPGGVLEVWFSERGKAARLFRSDDVPAVIAFLRMRVLAQGLKRFPRGSYEDASGFTVSAPGSDRVLLEWGEGRWAEMFEPPALDNALVWTWIMGCSDQDLDDSIRSRDGAPAFHVRRPPGQEALPGTGDARRDVQEWRAWLRRREEGAG